MAAGYDGTIKIDSRIDSKGFNQGVKSMGASLKPLIGIIAAVFSIAAITAFIKASITAAAHMANLMNRFKGLYGGSANWAMKQFEVMSERINIAIDDLMDMGTTLQNVFTALGFSTGKSAELSIQLTALTEDLATFYGVSGSDMAETMMMAMQGMTRGLKKLGISITEADIKNKALELGLIKTGQTVNAQVKAQAILALIIQKTSAAQGNAEKVAHGWAGEMRGLTGAWEMFKEAVGKAFLIFAPILAMIHTVIDWLTALAEQFATFVALFFGIKIDTGAMAENLNEAAVGAGDLEENTQGAAKAAKGALASFDELNVLAQDSGSGGGGGVPEPPGGGLPVEPPVDTNALDEIAKRVEAFKAKLLEMLGPTITELERLKTVVSGLGETVWSGLKWAWDNIIVPLGKWVVTYILPLFINILASALSILNSVLIALAPIGQWLWDNFLKPIAEWTGGVIVTVLTDFANALQAIADWAVANPSLFQDMVVAITAIGVAIGIVNIAQLIWNGIMTGTGIVATLARIGIDLLTGATTLSGAASWIAATATTVFGAAVAFLTSPIFLVVLAIAALIFIVYLLIKHWDDVKNAASVAWEWIKGVWAVVAQWFQDNVVAPITAFFAPLFSWLGIVANDTWLLIKYAWGIVSAWFNDNVIIPVTGWFRQAWTDISGFFTSLWADIQKIMAPVVEWFNTTIVKPLSDAWGIMLSGQADGQGTGGIRGFFTTVFNGIKDFIKGIFNGIIGLINGILSGIVSGINTIIKAANTVGKVIPGWTIIPDVVAPVIPKLATGAVIPPNSQFLAVLGDQKFGRNIEAPENLIRQIVREEVNDRTITIRFDGTMGQFIRMLKPVIDQENNRVGKSLIKVGG